VQTTDGLIKRKKRNLKKLGGSRLEIGIRMEMGLIDPIVSRFDQHLTKKEI